jgi:hypothetical protein
MFRDGNATISHCVPIIRSESSYGIDRDERSVVHFIVGAVITD